MRKIGSLSNTKKKNGGVFYAFVLTLISLIIILAGLAVHVPVARMTAAEIEQYIPLLREASFKISDFLAETDNLNSKI